MKKNSFRKSLIVSALALFSAQSYAWYCPYSPVQGGYTNLVSWFQQYNARWQSTVAPVGNFQTAMNTAEQTIQTTLDKMETALMNKFNQSDANIEKAIGKFVTTVNSQLESMGTAQITSNNAIAEYENQDRIIDEVNKIAEEAEQPITNCMQFAVGQSLTNTFATMKKTASASALDIAQRGVNASSTALVSEKISQYQDLKKNYGESTDPVLKDADVNASLLFGSHTGALTRYQPKQDDASKAFISNIVREYDIPARMGVNQEQLGQGLGKRYTNLQRRMGTYLGLATHSLESIRANHQANPSLVSFYTAAKLTPNPSIKANGVSVAEVLDTYAQKMIGPENTAAIAGAKSTTTVLRQMAQNNAMRLWVKNQKIQSAERIQAMEAAKLALLAEEVLGNQAQVYSAAAKQ